MTTNPNPAPVFAPGEAEELLKALMTCFYHNGTGGLEWSFVEGTTVGRFLGKDVEEKLKPLVVG